jgi:hypothetical protein
MKRFSILRLMGLILVLAVAIAALRDANDVWSTILPLLTLGVIGVALLGVVYSRGKARAGWLGFALFGGVYHLLAMGPWISDQTRPTLPTTRLLDYVHTKVVYGGSSRTVFLNANFTNTSAQGLVYPIPPANYTVTAPSQPQVVMFTSNASPAPPSQLLRILPGAANYVPFQRVGHSLAALLAGLLGAWIARRFCRKRTESTESA